MVSQTIPTAPKRQLLLLLLLLFRLPATTRTVEWSFTPILYKSQQLRTLLALSFFMNVQAFQFSESSGQQYEPACVRDSFVKRQSQLPANLRIESVQFVRSWFAVRSSIAAFVFSLLALLLLLKKFQRNTFDNPSHITRFQPSKSENSVIVGHADN